MMDVVDLGDEVGRRQRERAREVAQGFLAGRKAVALGHIDAAFGGLGDEPLAIDDEGRREGYLAADPRLDDRHHRIDAAALFDRQPSDVAIVDIGDFQNEPDEFAPAGDHRPIV